MLTHVSIIWRVLDPISAFCLSVFFMFLHNPHWRKWKYRMKPLYAETIFSRSLKVVEGLLSQLCFCDRSAYLNFLPFRVHMYPLQVSLLWVDWYKWCRKTSDSKFTSVVGCCAYCPLLLFWADDQVKAAIGACVTSRNSSLQTTKGCVQWSKYGCGAASDIVLWLGSFTCSLFMSTSLLF